MMQRKWAMLAATMTTVALVATGFRAGAQDDSPLEKIMEKINSKNVAVRKAVRTAAAFKKSGKSIVTNAQDVIKLAKEARAYKEPAEKQKKSYDEWTKLMDAMIKEEEGLADAAQKNDLAASKAAFANVNKSCTNCHTVFRVEEEEEFK